VDGSLTATVLSLFVPVLKHVPEAELGPVQAWLCSALFDIMIWIQMKLMKESHKMQNVMSQAF
jgi:hypothetical protein